MTPIERPNFYSPYRGYNKDANPAFANLLAKLQQPVSPIQQFLKSFVQPQQPMQGVAPAMPGMAQGPMARLNPIYKGSPFSQPTMGNDGLTGITPLAQLSPKTYNNLVPGATVPKSSISQQLAASGWDKNAHPEMEYNPMRGALGSYQQMPAMTTQSPVYPQMPAPTQINQPSYDQIKRAQQAGINFEREQMRRPATPKGYVSNPSEVAQSWGGYNNSAIPALTQKKWGQF